jgi:hypothetical protein
MIYPNRPGLLQILSALLVRNAIRLHNPTIKSRESLLWDPAMDVTNVAESLFLMVWAATLMAVVGRVFIGRPGRGFLRLAFPGKATVIVVVGSSCLGLGTVGLWREQVVASHEIADKAVPGQEPTALEKVGEFGAAIADFVLWSSPAPDHPTRCCQDEHVSDSAPRVGQDWRPFVLVAHSALQLLLADSISRWAPPPQQKSLRHLRPGPDWFAVGSGPCWTKNGGASEVGDVHLR